MHRGIQLLSCHSGCTISFGRDTAIVFRFRLDNIQLFYDAGDRKVECLPIKLHDQCNNGEVANGI